CLSPGSLFLILLTPGAVLPYLLLQTFSIHQIMSSSMQAGMRYCLTLIHYSAFEYHPTKFVLHYYYSRWSRYFHLIAEETRHCGKNNQWRQWLNHFLQGEYRNSSAKR